MLGAGGQAVFLQAFDFRRDDGSDELGILAVLRANLVVVGLEGHVNAHRVHGLAIEGGQLVGQFRIVGIAERFVRLVNVAAPSVVFPVRGVHHGDAQPFRFRHGLQIVQDGGNFRGCAVQVEQLAGQVEVLHHVGRIIKLGVHAEQQANFFFHRHLAEQVGHALIGALAPVLIDVQRTVLVQILKLVPVHFQDGGNAFHVRQTRLLAIRLNQGKLTGFPELGFRFIANGLFFGRDFLASPGVGNVCRAFGLFFLSENAEEAANSQQHRQQQGQFLHGSTSFP